jgi:hypothetical protein
MNIWFMGTAEHPQGRANGDRRSPEIAIDEKKTCPRQCSLSLVVLFTGKVIFRLSRVCK